ncbi:transcriptional regulator [Hypericibacter adhaerens]|uniref:Transcriptional regulator n=1 Tax=Hypericibacter adhaerens TaxID=2602016 RepID=A0A5J6NA10_9PROT|nr:LysR family transcriptional regulator [Hypericibacter adhaerens]QEX24456.1 transcriptional regulator [Hypericibacter adhaerens]
MEINDLRYFIRAVELESISRAADALGITQPALSRQIRELENELKQPLLVRTGRGVQPTDAGRRFATEAARILEEVDALPRSLRSSNSSPTGVVSLAMPASIANGLLPRLYAVLGREFPGIHLKVSEAVSSTSAEWLRNRTVDLAIQYERADIGNLHADKLIDEPLCLISAPGRELTAAPCIDFATIEQIELILPSRDSGLRRMLEFDAARLGLKLHISVEIDSVSAMKNLVAAGLGHTILPQFSVLAEVAAGLMVAKMIGAPRLTRGLVIARLAHRTPSLAMLTVIQAIRDVMDQYVFGPR